MVVYDPVWGRAVSVEKTTAPRPYLAKRKKACFRSSGKRKTGIKIGKRRKLSRDCIELIEGSRNQCAHARGVSRNNNASVGWTDTSPGIQTKKLQEMLSLTDSKYATP
jgi:hypothetical protein